MRQLNFLLFFALCLALALFSIENTQTAAINIIPNVQVEAPLSIELLLAVGTGAMLAWMFSVWDQLQRQIESWKAQRELKEQSKKIAELEKTLSELQASESNAAEKLTDTAPDKKVDSSRENPPKLIAPAEEIATEKTLDETPAEQSTETKTVD